MPLLGTAALLLSFDIEAKAVEEHDRWHTHEHLPERLSIPGFLRGTRWTATQGAPRYLVIYEVQALDTLSSAAYRARLDDPTPWTQRMMRHYRGMTRGLCAVRGSHGFGTGGAAALIRFAPEPSRADDVRRWLLEEVLPAVPSTPGLGSGHLFESGQAAAMTNEQRIRGADEAVHSALVVTGYDPRAVSDWACRLDDGGDLAAWAGGTVAWAAYRLDYTLASTEMQPG